MSIFRELAGAARDAHSTFFGDSGITLTESDGSSRRIRALLHKSRTETTTDASGRENRRTVRDATLVNITSIRHDATLTVAGETWAIDNVLDHAGSGLRVQLVRVTQHQTQRPGYRGKS